MFSKQYKTMKIQGIKWVALATAAFSLLSSQVLTAQGADARIKIDTDRQVGEISPLIYGNFTEHLGRCIYGGLYEPGSQLADEQGFRKDVIEGTQKLNATIVRWPGGNFVSGYHWEDGIGPKDKRPTRIDLAWGARESNQFGTDEFIQWCRKVNTQPYFCVNLGTGSMDEARNWVEYCNVEKGTYYSDLRRQNGFEKPHKVIYWGLGNEMDGNWQMGHKNADDYGKYALETAKLMKWIDRDIKLIASGSSDYGGNWIEWNRTILSYLKDHVDYISVHNYVGNRSNNYYEFMGSTRHAENVINITRGLIKEATTKSNRRTPIYIAFDEYNVWYRGAAALEEHYNMEDALVVAMFLNAFVRNADTVKMANMAQLVNVIAPMFSTPDGLWYQTIFYPLEAFANHCKGTALQTYCDSKTYNLGNAKVPYLDVSSAYDKENKEIIVNVVNRHKDEAINTDILNQSGVFKGTATLYEVNSKDIKDMNSATEHPVSTVTKQIDVNGNTLNYSFPAHSFTLIRIPVAEE
jgi:alpha-N-arabinofuranosidase